VWQGKDLQTARNEILARFSDVWQGKELAPRVMSGPSKIGVNERPSKIGVNERPSKIGVNEWPLSETARDKRESAMSRVRFQEPADTHRVVGKEGAGRGQFWKREA
jgi:hypothetical protein